MWLTVNLVLLCLAGTRQYIAGVHRNSLKRIRHGDCQYVNNEVHSTLRKKGEPKRLSQGSHFSSVTQLSLKPCFKTDLKKRAVFIQKKGLRAFSPFVHEHSLLSTIHKFFKMEVKVFADFLNKSGVSCHYVCLQFKFRF